MTEVSCQRHVGTNSRVYLFYNYKSGDQGMRYKSVLMYNVEYGGYVVDFTGK